MSNPLFLFFRYCKENSQRIFKNPATENLRRSCLAFRLPGYGDSGPTLEIFQYNHTETEAQKRINRPGLTHIAFAVEDVAAACEAVLAAGGSDYGKMAHVEINGAGTITFVYVTDPEGNIVELQHWEAAQ